MTDDGWLVAAKLLPLGGRGRYAHECGNGEAMIISHNNRGYSGYCNRCHANEFQGHGQRTFKELMELRAQEKDLRQELGAEVKLPSDFTLDIPVEGRLWLYKASITPGMAREAEIGYSPYFKRVIIPVFDQGGLVYFQARALHDYQDIKYINPRVDRSNIAYWVGHNDCDKARIIVTEDILSAIRVGQFIPTMSALGTRLSIPLANRLSEYDEVTTWLDPDSAGIKGAHEMRKLLTLTTRVSDIVSRADPKNLTNEEIKQCLKL